MQRLSESLKPYRTIIWDWNGTLLNDAQYALDIINQLFTSKDLLPISIGVYKKDFGFPIIDYYKKVGLVETKEEFDEMTKFFIAEYRKSFGELSLHPGTIKLLTDLKESGKQMYVLSATQSDELQRQLAHFDLLDFFEAYQGLANFEANCKKGAGEILLQEYNIDPESSVMVGDTVHDVEVAKALKLKHMIFLGHGHACSSRLSSEEVEIIDF